MPRSRILLISGVLLFFGWNSDSAQTNFNPDSALQRILAAHQGTHLSLRQAVENAAANDVSVKIAEEAYLSALGSVRREKGRFDPEYFLNINYQSLNTPTASFFSGAPILVTQQTDYRTGLSLLLPWGTQLDLSVTASRLKTNSEFAFLNPEYDTYGRIGFRQPFLAGFDKTARQTLSESERGLEARKAGYDQQVLSVGFRVEQAYWDLYAFERNYAVQELTRNQAEALLQEALLREKAGLVGSVQVANARTFLAEQELLLLDREEQLDQQSDQLAAMMGQRPEASMPRFLPSDEPPKEFAIENVEAVVDLALKNNLDLQAAQHDIEQIQVSSEASAWRALPKLDLVGSLSGSGLAGVPRDVVFGGQTLSPTRSGSFGDAVSQISRREFPGWNLGIEFTLPIGLRRDMGERDRLEAEVRGARMRRLDLSRNLEKQVRSLFREIDHGKRRIEAAVQSVEAAKEQVRIGLIEFRNGRTTAFELVRLGSDMASAEQRYTDALTRTAKSAAALRQLTSGKYPGTIK